MSLTFVTRIKTGHPMNVNIMVTKNGETDYIILFIYDQRHAYGYKTYCRMFSVM